VQRKLAIYFIMEEEKNKVEDRFTDIQRIRHYKVMQIVRRQGVKITFSTESMKAPGSFFTIVGLDIAESIEVEKNIFLNEIRMFSSINHPFILHYHECFVDKKTAMIW
jgi:hypothetical protein